MQKIMALAFGSALVVFLIIWDTAGSGSASTAVQITTSVLVSGGGFIAGGMIGMVMFDPTEEHSDDAAADH